MTKTTPEKRRKIAAKSDAQPDEVAPEALTSAEESEPASKRKAPLRSRPFALVPPELADEFRQWLKDAKKPKRLGTALLTIESQAAQAEFLSEKGINPRTAAAMRRAQAGTRLSPEKYRALMQKKGWTYRLLSEEWQIGETWLQKKIADPQRPKMWDHAVMGLPVHKEEE